MLLMIKHISICHIYLQTIFCPVACFYLYYNKECTTWLYLYVSKRNDPSAVFALAVSLHIPTGGCCSARKKRRPGAFIQVPGSNCVSIRIAKVADMAMTKVYIVYYSLYGHVEIMARQVQIGANSVQDVEATIWQVPETLPDLILRKMKAPPKPNDVPVIRPEQLLEADGFLFGFPSRFGVMAAQCKAFFDATHDLWASQALAGKPAGIFWSTGFHGGGQELTALTAVTQLAHHGMLFVPLGYTFGSGMFEMNEVKGGSSYGSGTYAADGTREPTELELQQAFHQGKYLAEITKKLKGHPQ